MVFLDTCIWIELCGVKSPTKPNEIKQANLAGNLLQGLLANQDTIVTCKEQLLEIISAVQKIKLKEYNRNVKKSGGTGCGDLKEFRERAVDFQSTKMLCQTVVDDVTHFSNICDCSYSVDDILSRIDLADINDCIYYDYCQSNGIVFYTFDSDIEKLGEHENVHVLK